MFLGSVSVTQNAVVTHRDSYLLANLSVVSVRRPFLASALILGAGFGGFGFIFADLLYANEIILIAVFCAMALAVGNQIGQLKLLSRDLKGSELSGAIYGQYGRLNRVRHDIVVALQAQRRAENHGDKA